jgi:hypothetical protein
MSAAESLQVFQVLPRALHRREVVESVDSYVYAVDAALTRVHG